MAEPKANANQTPHFMVIDDSIEFKEVMEKFLAATFNAEVSGFVNGSEAIEFAKQNKIDFFFVDLEMDVDGIEVINTITDLEQYKLTPIFVITAHDNADNRLDSICSGATSFITKPVNFDQLSQQIQIVVDKWNSLA